MKHLGTKLKFFFDNYPESDVQKSNLVFGDFSKEVEKLEAIIGYSLPNDFKVFYSYFNGQAGSFANLIYGDTLLSIYNIICDWNNFNDAHNRFLTGTYNYYGMKDGRMQKYQIKGSDIPLDENPHREMENVLWHPGWIPFTSNGYGDAFCIDLVPSKYGKKGQVFRLIHDRNLHLLSESFEAFLAQYLSDLQKGVIIYDENYKSFFRVIS